MRFAEPMHGSLNSRICPLWGAIAGYSLASLLREVPLVAEGAGLMDVPDGMKNAWSPSSLPEIFRTATAFTFHCAEVKKSRKVF